MMIDWDKWQEIFDSINKHRLRTILTAFGVSWGIFMLVLLLGAGQGLQNGVSHNFAGDATNSLWINSGRTSLPFNGLKEGRQIALTNEDYEFLWDQFSQIESLSGKYFLRGSKTVTYNGVTRSYSVQATHPDGQVIESLEILSGRFYNDRDMREHRKVAVIGQYVKQELFGDEDPEGQNITIDATNYKVIGVFYDKEGEQTMRRIYLPMSTVQKVYSAFDKMDQLVVVTGDLSEEDMSVLEASVKTSFSQRKKFDKDDPQALRIYNRARDYQSFMSLMNAIKGLMWFVGIFSIVAGVIGVSNIMLIIVKDRTKEIGIRKALGATPSSIVGMIFQESIFITGVAGYLGLGAGIAVLALLQGIESEFFRRPEINIWIAIGATMILVLAGAMAGLLPALQAARINPVTAIKSE